jgi:hypothetical protein
MSAVDGLIEQIWIQKRSQDSNEYIHPWEVSSAGFRWGWVQIIGFASFAEFEVKHW